jgi:hypothetical protein
MRLLRSHFGVVASSINQATARRDASPHRQRDRGIFYYDHASDQPFAALAFHVPRSPRASLEVLEIGLRTDREDLIDASLIACHLLMAYLQAAGTKLGREPGLSARPSSAAADVFFEFGFRPQRAPHASGRQVWRKPPFELYE